MAGDESLNWHPLIADFILVGQRLEQLGFIYSRGVIIVVEPEMVEQQRVGHA
jgi:hypothetical protein